MPIPMHIAAKIGRTDLASPAGPYTGTGGDTASPSQFTAVGASTLDGRPSLIILVALAAVLIGFAYWTK